MRAGYNFLICFYLLW